MDAKQETLALIVEIDRHELAVRLMEIGVGLDRGSAGNRTACQIIEEAKSTWPAGFGPFPFDRMAAAAIEFMMACI
jgi:hypothetical protein